MHKIFKTSIFIASSFLFLIFTNFNTFSNNDINPDYLNNNYSGPNLSFKFYDNKNLIKSLDQALAYLPSNFPQPSFPSNFDFIKTTSLCNFNSNYVVGTNIGAMISISNNLNGDYMWLPIIKNFEIDKSSSKISNINYYDSANVNKVYVNQNNLYLLMDQKNSNKFSPGNIPIIVEYSNINELYLKYKSYVNSNYSNNDLIKLMIQFMDSETVVTKTDCDSLISSTAKNQNTTIANQMDFDQQNHFPYIACDSGIFYGTSAIIGRKINNTVSLNIKKFSSYSNKLGSSSFNDEYASAIAFNKNNELFIGCEQGLVYFKKNFSDSQLYSFKNTNGIPSDSKDNLSKIVADSDNNSSIPNHYSITDISFSVNTSLLCTFTLSSDNQSSALYNGILVNFINPLVNDFEIFHTKYNYDFAPSIFFQPRNNLFPTSGFPTIPPKYSLPSINKTSDFKYEGYNSIKTINVNYKGHEINLAFISSSYAVFTVQNTENINDFYTNYQIYNNNSYPSGSFEPKNSKKDADNPKINSMYENGNKLYVLQDGGISVVDVIGIKNTNFHLLKTIGIICGSTVGGLLLLKLFSYFSLIMKNKLIKNIN